ncbi:hypothetical protein EGI31_19745 [Lacihabitans soyangensis]|uniref:Uncharacterized protein n=1 Tax=Lacihabitans soyangensis TaxID=869394 RepID=A0AAE3KUQ0_9BACT|nr:hypothetical protein [Lacihabitans soyangensis]
MPNLKDYNDHTLAQVIEFQIALDVHFLEKTAYPSILNTIQPFINTYSADTMQKKPRQKYGVRKILQLIASPKFKSVTIYIINIWFFLFEV